MHYYRACRSGSFKFYLFSFFFCISITYGWRGRLSFSFAFSGNGVCKKPHLGGRGGGVFFWVGKKSRCVVYKIYHVLQNPSLVYTASYSALTFENELRCWLQTRPASQPASQAARSIARIDQRGSLKLSVSQAGTGIHMEYGMFFDRCQRTVTPRHACNLAALPPTICDVTQLPPL